MFTISENSKSFTISGEKAFYLADTCWSAFTNIKEEDWDFYLEVRKNQGFNVIQANILWQWDSSVSELDILPFEKNIDGIFDFSKPNEAYFSRVEKMVQMAKNKGITMALVLLWCNYLPGTWISKFGLGQVGHFSNDDIVNYVTMVAKRLREYKPIYIVSGDTDFPSDSNVTAAYLTAMKTVKFVDKDALITLHTQGHISDLPQELKNSPALDFYMYQSGHDLGMQEAAYSIAQAFNQVIPSKPVINGEPCYEMMGYSLKSYGRFSRRDVRIAAWQSVLSGASAGITYGAHGVWSWYDRILSAGTGKKSMEAFDTPYDWRVALKFKGAWDYCFLKNFFETYDLFDLVPHQEILRNGSEYFSEADKAMLNSSTLKPEPGEEIRVAENKKYILVYIPSNTKVKLAGDLSCKYMNYLDLDTQELEAAVSYYDSENNQTVVDSSGCIEDSLLIINK